MNFYKVRAESWESNELSVAETSEFTAFMTNNRMGYICDIAVAAQPEFAGGLAKLVCAEMGLSPLPCEPEEITVSEFKKMLNRAARNGLDEASKLELKLGLNSMVGIKDFIAKKISRNVIEKNAAELLYGKSILPELDRIYAKPNDTGRIYHPVHYILRCHKDESCEIINGLVSALYENHRLLSLRCCKIEHANDMSLREAFELMRGGTAIFNVELGDGGGAFRRGGVLDEYDIKALAPLINANLRDVLTVIVVRGESDFAIEKLKSMFDASFVTLSYENADYNAARSYLTALAEKSGLDYGEELFDEISSGKKYGKDELLNIYNRWYNRELKTVVFPQYAHVISPNSSRESAKSDAEQKLRSMVGLEKAKEIIFRAVNFYRMRTAYQRLGKAVGRPSMHMVFTGNPGTAKTTVARLFAQILKDNDIITYGKLVEVGRADIVGKYVGHTAPLVRKAFDNAEGGVLFIDEAYSLLDEKNGLYGDEAINTIVQEMENRRDRLIVIFAGYKKEMENFLDRNTGLRSRVAFTVPFEDYTPAELLEIARLMAKDGGNALNPPAEKRLAEIFALAVREKNFGNGRFVRNIMERAEINRASRLASADDITISMAETFTAEDFDWTPSKTEKRSVGFMA